MTKLLLVVLVLGFSLNVSSQNVSLVKVIDSTIRERYRGKEFGIHKRVNDTLTFYFMDKPSNDIFLVSSSLIGRVKEGTTYTFYYIKEKIAKITMAPNRKSKKHYAMFYFSNDELIDEKIVDFEKQNVELLLEMSRKFYRDAFNMLKEHM